MPNRKRGQNGVDPETFNRVARLWFTSPTAISFDDLGTHLGWQADEVRRKVATWLGYRAGIPKNVKMPVRIASRGLRSALLDCPLAEVRHAVWAALVPAEAQVADYLTAAYRDHVAATYLDPNMVWVLIWAADTHVFRRRLMDLCLEQPQRAGGVRFDAAAAALAIGETDIADFSRTYKISPRRNGGPRLPGHLPESHPVLAQPRGPPPRRQTGPPPALPPPRLRRTPRHPHRRLVHDHLAGARARTVGGAVPGLPPGPRPDQGRPALPDRLLHRVGGPPRVRQRPGRRAHHPGNRCHRPRHAHRVVVPTSNGPLPRGQRPHNRWRIMSSPLHAVGAAIRADITALATELRMHMAADRADDARDALYAAMGASDVVVVELISPPV